MFYLMSCVGCLTYTQEGLREEVLVTRNAKAPGAGGGGLKTEKDGDCFEKTRVDLMKESFGGQIRFCLWYFILHLNWSNLKLPFH